MEISLRNRFSCHIPAQQRELSRSSQGAPSRGSWAGQDPTGAQLHHCLCAQRPAWRDPGPDQGGWVDQRDLLILRSRHLGTDRSLAGPGKAPSPHPGEVSQGHPCAPGCAGPPADLPPLWKSPRALTVLRRTETTGQGLDPAPVPPLWLLLHCTRQSDAPFAHPAQATCTPAGHLQATNQHRCCT